MPKFEPVLMDARIRDFLHVFNPLPGKELWYGGPSLFGILRGVKAEQAAWLAPGQDHSLWQLALHCAYGRYAVRRSFEGSTERGGFPRVGGYWSRLPAVLDEKAWKADLALLKAEQEGLVDAVMEFDARRLDEKAIPSCSYADLLWGVVMHDVLHVGEMMVLKKLYRQQAHKTPEP